MSFNQLIFRNLKKNLKNYYLYVFALIFSVALYFAFVTLQYDPAMDEAEGSIKGAAGIRAGAILLIAIVTVFLVYANNLFIKRRSKEIGLFQLVGMTKAKIFSILTMENMILYFGSMVIGIFLGFSSSKLLMMILMNVIGIEDVAELRFSTEALIQTILVFVAIYLVIMFMNFLFIRRQRILTLFQATSTTENKRNRVSKGQVVIGILGIALIALGYYLSTELFSGNIVSMITLLLTMVTILASVILGTYLFYKGSISFIFNLIRKRNKGYLSINKVLSLSSIMFRMKSNALLLTVITTLSALAIGLLSLAYISYYSAEKTAKDNVVYDYSIPIPENAAIFKEALENEGIEYTETVLDIVHVMADLSDIFAEMEGVDYAFDASETNMVIASDEWMEEIDLSPADTVFANTNEAMMQFMGLEESGEIGLSGESLTVQVNYSGYDEDIRILPLRLTGGGFPIAIVDESVYQQLKADKDPEVQGEYAQHIGIDIDNRSDLDAAEEIYQKTDVGEWAAHSSQLETFQDIKQNMGLMMFVVGFLGLAFLITSGCILYFKQMDEGEEEKSSYTILRKLGFTNEDLVNGIKIKQVFNFGIPLIVGISHGYFAVKSGWFFFGTELWTPMIIVVVLYAILYSIFGILSVMHYKKIIKEAL
ncbi:ABC transporter permease [Oceanobacillus piezotolerans]|uniref:ABC transporter permease n=1 Tax=Oceanobacillus piezotolerans TaxID=2448030 RepID=A0A498D4X8_9BACI|nr:ABC transporter permease [Oceanobacillus piezotolerans]RLL43663.1 ABC transporter permease [Oceanobacillus piezotolerans]